MNERSPEKHYKIMIRPAENGITLKPEYIDKTYRLDEGEAIYATKLVRGFNLLLFERDGWQFILSVDKRVSKQVPFDVLVNIANSIKD